MLLGVLLAEEFAAAAWAGPPRAPACVRFFIRLRAILIVREAGILVIKHNFQAIRIGS